jgi:hypothetical protein
MKTPKRLRLGMTTTACRVSNSHHSCKICGETITPSLQYVLFQTFRTSAFTSRGIRHRSHIAWRVVGHAHLACMSQQNESATEQPAAEDYPTQTRREAAAAAAAVMQRRREEAAR